MWVRTRIAIACLLAAWPAIGQALPRESFETLERIGRLRDTVAAHQKAVGGLPDSASHLGALTRLYTSGTPLEGGVPIDAWKRALIYRLDDTAAEGYVLYSPGPNGLDEAGEGDDLGARKANAVSPSVRKAQQLLPVVVLVTVGPLAFAAIRSAKRLTA